MDGANVLTQTKSMSLNSGAVNFCAVSGKYSQVAFSHLATAAIAGAQILVNTVGHIKGDLLLTDKEYGLAMTLFGIGATVAAFTSNMLDRSKNKTTLLLIGACMLAIAVSFGNVVSYNLLLVLWMIAGLGQSFTEMPSQILIAENMPLEQQGKVYGSHFAWSHLWWAIGYPIAGFTGTYFRKSEFLIGGLLTLCLMLLIWFFVGSKKNNVSY